MHGHIAWSKRTLDNPIRDVGEGSFARCCWGAADAGASGGAAVPPTAKEATASPPCFQTARSDVEVLRRGSIRAMRSVYETTEGPDEDGTARVVPCTLVRVRIHTGRRHQIRVHLFEAGHPILGDSVYCEENMRRFRDNPKPRASVPELLSSVGDRPDYDSSSKNASCGGAVKGEETTSGKTNNKAVVEKGPQNPDFYRMFLHARYLEFPDLDLVYESDPGFAALMGGGGNV